MGLLTVSEALERVLAAVKPLSPESVGVSEALGRALAAEVTARRTLPAWPTSAMDGYAVRAADLGQVPRRLAVVETVFAGQAPQRAVGPGECARIMTGARVPDGADAVVMQERTTPLPGAVEVLEAPAPGANLRKRGEDVAEGAVLLRRGAVLGVSDAAALWAQGLGEVRVARRPTVAVATSGDELCAVGEEPGERTVDTNSPVIAELVRRAGGRPTELGISADRLEAISQTLRRGLEHDVLIAIAGASVGEKDYTREALQGLGVQLDFWRVAMKPGKPLALGRRGATLVFGLPGNPASAMVTFELFVRPALRALQGLPPEPALRGRAAVALPKGSGLTHFLRATVELRDGVPWASPLATQASGALRSTSGATHLVVLRPDAPAAAVGDEVTLIPVSWA